MSEQTPRVGEARRVPPALTDEVVTMAHGSGGKAMHRLIEALFLEAFDNPVLATLDDQAVLAPTGAEARLAFTTDSFVVSPLFFPGGDIGKLAVNGTVNDLAMAGAEPLCLSAGFILEEGFPVSDLRRIVASMAEACKEAGVAVVTGDTKVVNRGKADGVFINTAGVGLIRRPVEISSDRARPGDLVLVSGPIGDHGTTIMVARGGLEVEAELESDTAPLGSLVGAILDASADVHCLRDPTRGGVATALNEFAGRSEVAIVLEEERVPVRDSVRAACEILGMDPLYVACEGRLVAVVGPEAAEDVLAAMRRHPLGTGAAVIGQVAEEPRGRVLLRTPFGGTRVVDMLVGDPLPRIC